jgi:hypothetical protein
VLVRIQTHLTVAQKGPSLHQRDITGTTAMTDHLSTPTFDRPVVPIAKLKPVRTAAETEMHRMLNTERDGMREMLERVAVHREADPDAATDPSCAEATRSVRHLAATMIDVPDDLLLRIGAINRITGGLLSALIAARLCGIGSDFELHADATAFYQSFADMPDIADWVKRKCLN